MAGITVEDNFLDPLLLNILYNRIMDGPMNYQASSDNRHNIKFFQSHIELNTIHAEYLCRKFMTMTNKKIRFIRGYANIQFQNMDGGWHTDDGENTFLLMLSDTLKSGDGCFEVKNKTSLDFVKNRCIMFNAKDEHRGLASKLELKPRVTLAFKSKEI
jgi:hypothetical protein